MSTGAEYMLAITRRTADRRARAAFLALAQRLVPPGTGIFDFGAGPGLDAKHYARLGFRVLTYDVDPAMCRCLRDTCRTEIARQQIIPCAEFHRQGHEPLGAPAVDMPIGLVAANFAPFNLIEEPAAYFKQFHRLVTRGGKLLLSVLNPFFVGDMQYLWWWRNVVRLSLRGEYSVAGGNGPIYRRSPQQFRRLAEPYFALSAVLRGLPGDSCRHGLLRQISRPTSQYLFLVFDKCA